MERYDGQSFQRIDRTGGDVVGSSGTITMSKFRVRRLAFDLRERMREELYRTFASLESREEVAAFCRDLFTPAEIVMFVRRLHTARLLIAGWTYKEIMKGLAIGNSTVKSVANRLYRDGKGFTLVQKRLKVILTEITEEIVREMDRLENPRGFEALKKKYSMYFWPDLLIEEAPKTLREMKAARRRKASLSTRRD